MQDARRERHNRRRWIIIEHKSLPDISVEAGELDVSARADSFFFFSCVRVSQCSHRLLGTDLISLPPELCMTVISSLIAATSHKRSCKQNSITFTDKYSFRGFFVF